MAVLRYFDVVLLVLAAPIMLLIGVPAGGYLIGAGAWIVLRAVGVGVERYADGDRRRQPPDRGSGSATCSAGCSCWRSP